jgi:hypothetical protein
MKAPVADIQVEIVAAGVARVTVREGAYPQAARHWRQQLTGANAKKWGRIYCDPSKVEKTRRRAEHMSDYGGVIEDANTRKHGKGHINRDECPGAMFIWQTQAPADVEELCATDNQKFGRDLYWAMKRVLGKLDWWEVQFRFR